MDSQTLFLIEIALIMIVAGLSSVLFARLRMPAVIGYLAAGIVLGPAVFPNLITDITAVNDLANLGIILLMFSIGLDFNLKRLREIGGFAILAGTIEIAIMLAVGYSLGLALGFDNTSSIFLGAVMSISSTAVIVKVLGETGNLEKDYVEPMIGILIVEDLAATIILALASPLLAGSAPTVRSTIGIIAAIMLFIFIGLILGLAFIPRLVDRVKERFPSETLMLVVLGMAFGMALVSYSIGLSVAIGAFIMGIIIGQSRSRELVDAKIAPVKEMFMAIFFVSIGMLINPVLMVQNLLPALIIASVFIMGKWVAVGIGSYASNMPARTSFMVATSVVAMGEFSFIIAKAGVDANVLSDFFYSSVIGAALITMVFLPISAKHGPKVYDFIASRSPRRLREGVGHIEEMRTQARKRMAESAERRRELRREFIWLFVDITYILLVSIAGNFLLALSGVLEPVASAIGVLPSILSLVVIAVLMVPAVASIVSKLRNIARIIAASVLGATAYQALSQTFVYRTFRRLIVILAVIALLFALIPVSSLVGGVKIAAIIIVGAGALIAFLLWDFVRGSYEKVYETLGRPFLDDFPEEKD
jgi:CPA2 family monovalent cation:H+ antiporter-2